MIRSIRMAFLCVSLCLVSTAARAQDIPSDYQDVLKSLDRKGDFKVGVRKVNIPRSDLKMTVQGVPTPTPFGFGGWIALTKASGRIDHMSVDTKGQRLFVSALGNNTVEVIDVKEGKRIKTLGGLKQPQGVLYVADNDRLYVANGKDGSVRIFDGTSYALLKTIDYGDDADNLRYDSRHQRVYVGYGGGAIAAIDNQGHKGGEIRLDAHPESFQLAKGASHIYVNLPGSHKVAVLDLDKLSVMAKWGTGMAFANYPMAFDEANRRLFVVTRMPARLLVFDTESGKIIQSLPVVGDCDDVFYDKARKRIYASGGEGAISVVDQKDADHYVVAERVATVKGARTSFFSSDLDRLFLAVRRQDSQPAAIRIFAPAP